MRSDSGGGGVEVIPVTTHENGNNPPETDSSSAGSEDGNIASAPFVTTGKNIKKKTKGNLRRKSSDGLNDGRGGEISDPEEYSSLVAAAVANILTSSKSEDDIDNHSEGERKERISKKKARLPTDKPHHHHSSLHGQGQGRKLSENSSSVGQASSDLSGGGGGVGRNKKWRNKNGKKTKEILSTSMAKIISKAKASSSKKSLNVNSAKSAIILKEEEIAEEFFPIVRAKRAVSTPGFPRIALPVLVQKTPTNMELTAYLTRIQEYMNQLGYHRAGEPKIKVVTNMSIKHQMDTAKSIIKAGEPIKCLHALILGIHFTNCTNYVERFPINFKSNVNGQEYKHVVLGVYLYGMFGAVGISRDSGLQDKPPIYPKLIDLISDFHNSYEESGHVLKEVRIGGIITHDQHSLEPINWKVASSVNMEDKTGVVQEAAFEKITRALRAKMGATCLRSVRLTPSATSPTSGEQTSMNSSLNSSYSSNNAGVASKNPLAKKSKTVSVISSSSKKNTRK